MAFYVTAVTFLVALSMNMFTNAIIQTYFQFIELLKPKFGIHSKLHNINFCNVTYSLISQNSRERMFLVQISLLIVTFLFFISRVLPLMQTTIEVNPHPRIVPYVNTMECPFLFILPMSLVELLVHGCVTLLRKVKWEVDT